MKIGRNDPCPCGSGKKYKQCCLNKNKMISAYEQIRVVVKGVGYKEDIADILCSLYRYMKEKQWIGACHSTTAVLYVALSECGYSPKLCVGEVDSGRFLFDHSWIELDGKIIDLAIAMTLKGGLPLSAPIIFDINTDTKQKYSCIYGINYGSGLDEEAMFAVNTGFVTYMDSFPDEKNGLWGVVEKILQNPSDLKVLREKYRGVIREYINSNK